VQLINVVSIVFLADSSSFGVTVNPLGRRTVPQGDPSHDCSLNVGHLTLLRGESRRVRPVNGAAFSYNDAQCLLARLFASFIEP
jgi:hypothetical protein